MREALAAVSLTANILEFLTFGLKVISKGQRTYRSNDGILTENADLEHVTSDLLVLQTKLQRDIDPVALRSDYSEEDEALRLLLEASNKAAKELLVRLNKAKGQGRFRQWKSPRQAVKSVWCETDIDEMAVRLAHFRDQLQTRTIVFLR